MNHVISNIQKYRNRIIDQWQEHSDEINSDKNKKLLVMYTIACSSLAGGTDCVYSNGNYDSVFTITRSFVEGYSQFKILCSFWGTPSFEGYFRFLLLEDMIEDKKSYDALREDDSIIDLQKKQIDLDSYYERFSNLFSQYFPNTVIDQNNIILSTNRKLEVLWKKYNKKYPQYKYKVNRVQYALSNNDAYKRITGEKYDGASFVYRKLCAESHLTIGALDNRSVNEGVLSINKYTDDVVACINLVEICLNDMELEWSKILA